MICLETAGKLNKKSKIVYKKAGWTESGLSGYGKNSPGGRTNL
jgi:hypothetical protein